MTTNHFSPVRLVAQLMSMSIGMMMMMMMVGNVILIIAATEIDHRQLLEQLCRMEANAPRVTKLTDVGALISVLHTDPSVRCPLDIAEAILGLEPVIELTSVCSERAADLIVDYWAKYINDKSELSQRVPHSLRSLFIAYGLQASKLCKITMMNELQRATLQMRITEQDVQLVTRSLVQDKNFMKLFGSDPQLDALMMSVRTDSASASAIRDEIAERSRISLPPEYRDLFVRMQQTCQHKFKPVYGSLISPIVRLASIGLDYRGDSVVSAMYSFRRQRIYSDWFNVVFACESMGWHVPIDVPVAGGAAVAAELGAPVSVLDPEDLAELQARTGVNLDDGAAAAAAAAAMMAAVGPADYAVEVRMYNQVIDLSDLSLMESISRYGQGMEETTKSRMRMVKKLPSMLKSMFKSSKKVRFGLHPIEEQHKSRLRSVGARVSRKGKGLKLKRRLGIVAVSMFLIAGIGISTALLALFSCPLGPLWMAIGGWLISVILLGMLAGLVVARK